MSSTDPFTSEEVSFDPLITLPGRGFASILPYDEFRQRLSQMPASYAYSFLFSAFPDTPRANTESDLTAVLYGTSKGHGIIDAWVKENKGRLDHTSQGVAKPLPSLEAVENKSNDTQNPLRSRRDFLSKSAAAANFGFLAALGREGVMDSNAKKDVARLATGIPAGLYTYTNYCEYLVEERFLQALQSVNSRIEESYARQFGARLTPVIIAPGLTAKGR